MKISVITAVYNSEKTVADSLASVASQTYRDVEHIIVEGNSSDASLSVIEQASHDRMRLISEPDRGIYDALNKGIALATGEVIGFLHSDDFMAHDQVLARVAGTFEDPLVEAVFSDLDYVGKDNPSQVVRHWSTGPFHPKRLQYGWMPAHPTLYLRRDVYDRCGAFDINFDIAADYDFILRYFSTTSAKTVYLPEVLYKMRLGGVSNRNWRKVLQKMQEDLLAIRRNNIGGLHTLAIKNLSKIEQFFVK